MVFQSRDRGSSSGCAFDRSLDGVEESWQLSEEFSDAVVTGWKDEYLGLSSDHITVASKDGDDDGSLSSNDGSLYTEIRSTNHVAESEAEVWARLREQGFIVYDRSMVRLGKEIGKGAQGTIYQATLDVPFVSQPRPVAVKRFKSLEGVSHGLHQKELSQMRHMFVCKPDGVFFDEDSKLCTIMELFSGDLRKIIDAELESSAGNDDRPPFLEFVACHLIQQLAIGLEGLHQLGIYHRDLKAENILLQRRERPEFVDYDAVVADFESSYHIVGTGFWRAPEVLQALKDRTPLSDINWQAADIYSFGMVCYEILTGKVPFSGNLFSEQRDRVLSGDRPELPDHVPGPLKDIIRRCWDRDPGSRPSFTDILESLGQAYEFAGDMGRKVWDMFESLEPARTGASNLLLARQIISTHIEINLHAKGDLLTHLHWASKFVATVEQFVSEFGWKSYQLHPSLPLASSVERTRLVCLLAQQHAGFNNNFRPMSDYRLSDLEAAKYDHVYLKQRVELIMLVQNIHQELLKGLDLELKCEMDEELLLSEKLTIVEAFVKSLLDADVQIREINTLIMNLLYWIDPEYSSPEVVMFHCRMVFLLLWRAEAFRLFGIATKSIILYLIYQALRNFSYSNYVLTYLRCGFREVFLGMLCYKLDFYPKLFGSKVLPVVSIFLSSFSPSSIVGKIGFREALLTWVILGLIHNMIRVALGLIHDMILAPRRDLP